MSQPSPLVDALQQAVAYRTQTGLTTVSLDEALPTSAADLFSNDYLSLSTDAVVREHFLRQALAAPRLFGSTGSRLATGNSEEYNALEGRLQRFFGSSSALLFHSGFSANLAFFTCVPQKDDVIIYDELIHTSCREGFRTSAARGATYRFAHNSVVSFEECLRSVLRKHPQIMQGKSTVFISVESLYSMDGDFCPLTEIVQIVEDLVPAGRFHIIVDEAHTSAICGPNGSGYVSLLGLNHRVHTTVHTFGKAWGFHGAVVLTSPVIRNYLIHFAKSVIFSTSMPYTDIYALQCCLDVISSERGQELRESLHRLCGYARKQLLNALKRVPDGILCVDKSTAETHDHGLLSPIIPIFTPRASNLTDYLLKKGYGATAMTLPVVKRPRIRMIVHARNTEGDIDTFVNTLLQWATRQGQSVGPFVMRSVSSDNQYVETKARL
ncbi:8-amino-7-oxononanoate synthase [Paxillus ammoniavirescens]|nr:8-amino-7-oxononanoate synthase [Paxillus ammoniavirescens]